MTNRILQAEKIASKNGKPVGVKLQVTTNYEMFVQSEFNRDLRGLDKLRKSMQKHGFIPAYPLHCVKGAGGKLVIKAGHHRYEVAKSLGIEIYYIISEDMAAIPELEESSNKWSMLDFVKSFARAGSEAHLAVMEYSSRTGISVGQAISLLGGECANSHNLQNKARNGTYEVKPNEHSAKVESVVIGLRGIGVKFYANAQLVAAVSTVCWLDEFDVKIFLHRAATHAHLLVKQSSKDQFLALIDHIYNFQARQRIALAFLAKEAAKKRSAIGKHEK